MIRPDPDYLIQALDEASRLNLLLKEKNEKLHLKLIEREQSRGARMDKALQKINFIWVTAGGGTFFSKVLFFLSPLGLKLILKFFKKGIIYLFSFISNEESKIDTQDFNTGINISQTDIEKIKKEISSFQSPAKFSVICPLLYSTDKLSISVHSVISQTYPFWELILVVGEGQENIINELNITDHEKMKVVFSNTNFIEELCSRGLKHATGDYVGVLFPGAMYESNALYEFSKVIDTDNNVSIVYSDEDEFQDGKYLNAAYKPDWSPDLLLSSFYIGNSVFVKYSSLTNIGGFNVNGRSAFLYDSLLKITDNNDHVNHIPKLLIHSNYNPENTFLYHLDQKRAIENTIERRKLSAKVVTVGVGVFNVIYQVKDKPRVSIIIPTKDKSDVLEVCLNSIFYKSTYANFEVIVIDNNSVEKDTFELLKKFKEDYPDNFFSYSLKISFNYSRINNFAAEKSSGEYLLFLNNDTEIITPDWIEGMLGQAQRDEVGAVGVKLLYPDRKIQHAGMVIGLEWGGNTFVGEDEFSGGYLNYINQVRNYSAVTAACLMCRREVFEKVGGFEEEFAVEFNDSDFCLRLLEMGYFNIYIPHVTLLHYESLSRGYVHVSKESFQRHLAEKEKISKKWSKYFENDPYYNSNLSKKKGGFSINL